jgi:hemerythrin superfamily protein
MDLSGIVNSARKMLIGDDDDAASDIFHELKDDHQSIKSLLDTLKKSRPGRARNDDFKRLTVLVTSHARAEEKVLYEELKSRQAARSTVLEGYEEHHVADLLLAEMAALRASDERWMAKLAVLAENLTHHIDEEESEIFPEAKKALSDKRALQMGAGSGKSGRRPSASRGRTERRARKRARRARSRARPRPARPEPRPGPARSGSTRRRLV